MIETGFASSDWVAVGVLALGMIALARPFAAQAEERTPPIGRDVLAGPAGLPLLRQGTWLVGTDSRDVTGGNNDGFGGTYSYLYKEGDEWVLFEEEGPGCIYELRTILHQGNLHVYLDGADKPSYTVPFPDLYKSKQAPFQAPFVAHEDEAHGSCWSYIPIPFEKGCKITTDEMGRAHFFNIFAHRYLPGTPVKSFDPEDTMEAAQAWWSNPAQRPAIDAPVKTSRGTVRLAPRSADAIVDVQGAGAIVGLKLRIAGGALKHAGDMVLRGYWDGRAVPQVDSPVSAFFALGCPRALDALEHGDPGDQVTQFYKGGFTPPRSLFVGLGEDDRLYCHFPMPYWKSARMDLLNTSAEKAIEVEYEVNYTDCPYPWAADGVMDKEEEKAAALQSKQIKELDERVRAAQKRLGELINQFKSLDQEKDRAKIPELQKAYHETNAQIRETQQERDRLMSHDSTGYFHALWRQENPVRTGEDFCVLDARGRGHYVGCVLTFSSVQQDSPYTSHIIRNFLEGDARFYVDGNRTFIGASTGTEEYFNWGWYNLLPHDEVFQYPTHGYPLHAVCKNDFSVMYRFHIGEVVPYNRSFRFDLEHGPIGRTPANYSGTVFFYHRDASRLVRTDELDVGDAGSEKSHDYACDGLVKQERHTIPYEGSYQLPKLGDDPRDREYTYKDTGNVWNGSCTFAVAVAAENQGVKLRRRSYYGFGAKVPEERAEPGSIMTVAQRVAVAVDGKPAGDWYVPIGHARDTWRDTEFEIPAKLTQGKERVTITLTAKNGTEWDEYTYWVYSYVK